MVCIVPFCGKRTTMSRARFRMCMSLGRILEKHEHVDHKDDNKLNDKVTNFQILSKSANTIKEALRRGKKMAYLQCPGCSKRFTRMRSTTHLARGGTITFCSSVCKRGGIKFPKIKNVLKVYHRSIKTLKP